MGKRVHVAKKYVVEYGDTTGMNWNHDKFFDVLAQLGGEPIYVSGDQDCPSDYFECPLTDYKDAVENLKIHIESPEVYLPEDQKELMGMIEECGYTPQELLSLMERFLAEADTTDGYLHFAAF